MSSSSNRDVSDLLLHLTPDPARVRSFARALELRLQALELWLERQQSSGSIVSHFIKASATFQATGFEQEAAATRTLLGLYVAERGERDLAIQCFLPAKSNDALPAWLTAFAQASLSRLGQPSSPSSDARLDNEDQMRVRWIQLRHHPLVDVHDKERMLALRAEARNVFTYLSAIGALEEALLCAADLARIYFLLGSHKDLPALTESLFALAQNAQGDDHHRRALEVFSYLSSSQASPTSFPASLDEIYRSLSSLHRFDAPRVLVAALHPLADLETSSNA